MMGIWNANTSVGNIMGTVIAAGVLGWVSGDTVSVGQGGAWWLQCWNEGEVGGRGWRRAVGKSSLYLSTVFHSSPFPPPFRVGAGLSSSQALSCAESACSSSSSSSCTPMTSGSPTQRAWRSTNRLAGRRNRWDLGEWGKEDKSVYVCFMLRVGGRARPALSYKARPQSRSTYTHTCTHAHRCMPMRPPPSLATGPVPSDLPAEEVVRQ
jgi:hypothetical protein